jgi:hypothetical protein
VGGKAVFSNFSLTKSSEKMVIKGYFALKLWEQAGMFFLYLLVVFLILSFLRPLIPFGDIFSFSFIFSVLAALLLLNRFKLGVNLFKIDTISNTLIAQVDKFQTPLNEIKNLKIIEVKGNGDVKLFKLRYTLAKGEITSTFSFNSYNRLGEIVEILQKTS